MYISQQPHIYFLSCSFFIHRKISQLATFSYIRQSLIGLTGNLFGIIEFIYAQGIYNELLHFVFLPLQVFIEFF